MEIHTPVSTLLTRCMDLGCTVSQMDIDMKVHGTRAGDKAWEFVEDSRQRRGMHTRRFYLNGHSVEHLAGIQINAYDLPLRPWASSLVTLLLLGLAVG
ncbi:hypothetical protein GW17_00012020 [Ensete ventricosum]|nr:hypothetical protein GW17_00012020 [Ensete ventricosum]RZR89031.1 hypothetical protein BHM03_00016699 [Ensete ventricosum]